MSTTTSTDERALYAAGLRLAADILERDARLRLPVGGLFVSVYSQDEAALWIALLADRNMKADDFGVKVDGTIGGLPVTLACYGDWAGGKQRVPRVKPSPWLREAVAS